ncbi:aldehyde dehydrogenase family protein [Halomonas sp.]|uniref:aldehyde dehydrogenase family protein n=1 Tax=Halomonas sp. TaxID=1486246 RepID=UPI00257EC8A4|nr:aldehyde dehydrogenase family protein [Halomonas sp.]MCJ8287217.1 aldehyde dehydrogenase family protein [Halomonas sp.]NQY71932.1 aldehyde dehydrogenase family protein [Halomonas sp.]
MDAQHLDHETLYGNYVAGRWVPSSHTLDVIDPANGNKIALVSLASDDDIEHAVSAAKRVHENRILIDMHPGRRGRLLLRIADEIEKLKPQGARLLSRESGKRLVDAEGEFNEAANFFRYFAGMADKLEGRSIPIGNGYVDYTVYMPYGVTLHIVPWNFPVLLAARSLAPALASANTALVKVPEQDPLATLLLGVACTNAGVPEGAVSFLCGIGNETGERLIRHPDVQQVVFTGSVPIGQHILKTLAERVVPSVMELGGKSAAIVCDDANLGQVIDSIHSGIFFNSGQVCSAMSRLLVPESLHDEIVERIVGQIDGLSVGSGLENHDITPVISKRQANDIIRKCQAAAQSGATIVSGGKRIEREGFFVAPTLITNVSTEMDIAQEEVFGPVLCVIAYRNIQEALEIANGTDYGLVAGVFSQNVNNIAWLTERLYAGQVFVNEWFAGGIETPFGGVKMSGIGRDKGQESIYNYLQTKNIAIKTVTPGDKH